MLHSKKKVTLIKLYLFQAGIDKTRLQFVSEEEADIWYCKHLQLTRNDSESPMNDFPEFCIGNKYLVLNCGGKLTVFLG